MQPSASQQQMQIQQQQQQQQQFQQQQLQLQQQLPPQPQQSAAALAAQQQLLRTGAALPRLRTAPVQSEEVTERPPPFGCAWGPSFNLGPSDAALRRPGAGGGTAAAQVAAGAGISGAAGGAGADAAGGAGAGGAAGGVGVGGAGGGGGGARLFDSEPPRFHIPVSRPAGLFRTEELANGPFPMPEADDQWRQMYELLRQRRDLAGVRDMRGALKRHYDAGDLDIDRPDPAAAWRGPPAIIASHRIVLAGAEGGPASASA
ncbi:hypothetical protein HK405_011842 [Cladochytrium tenue]|nr:hypothetical protein HK405_011842 [Cladochytrium tenue]